MMKVCPAGVEQWMTTRSIDEYRARPDIRTGLSESLPHLAAKG